MILQVTAHGAFADLAAAEGLAAEFAQSGCMRLPGFLSPALLAQVQHAIDAAEFTPRAHGDIATELCMERNACLGMLHFLINDPVVYACVERVTGTSGLREFHGRVYRRLPGVHHDSWHSDVYPDRSIGLSVNLGREPYEGGVFEIRHTDAGTILGAIANTGGGDAILFKIADGLEHRVTGVTGTAPKTAFAGWFGVTRDYVALFRADPFVREEL